MADNVSTNPVPAPLYAPEQGGNPFIADAEHDLTPEPLTNMLGQDFKRGFSSSYDLLKLGVTKFLDMTATKAIQNGKDLNGFSPYLDLPSHNEARPPKFLNQEQWKSSPWFREGLKQPNGVYENVAEIQARNYDQDQLYKDEESRTNQATWAKIAQGAAGFAGGVSDPAFILMAVATDGIGVAPWLAEMLPIVKDSVMGTNVAIGTIEGSLINTEAAAVDYEKNVQYQEPADPMQIVYNGLIGAGLGGTIGAFAPILKSKFGKTLEMPKESFSDQAISSDSNETIARTAIGQLENSINPETSDLIKQAYFEKSNGIEKQIKRATGETDDEIGEIQVQRDKLQNALEQVNYQIEKETDPDELSALKTDKANLETQIENHDTLMDLKSDIPDQVSVETAKAGFKNLRQPEAETTFSEGDNEIFTPKTEEQRVQSELQNADDIRRRFDEVKEGLSDKARKFEEESEGRGIKLDAMAKVYKGIRKCLLGGA